MQRDRLKRHLPSLIATGALLLGACLPVPRTVTLSPAVTGVYRYEDGTPVAGAQMVLSTDPNDRTCANASLSTVTDAAGRFAFPAARRKLAFTVLLPYDPFYCYNVCGGTTPSDPLHRRCFGRSLPETDSIACRLWLTRDQAPSTAVSPSGEKQSRAEAEQHPSGSTADVVRTNDRVVPRHCDQAPSGD